MPYLNGFYPNIADHKGICGYGIQLDLGYAGITEISKRIWKFTDNHFLSHLICKNRHRFPRKKIEGTNIIHSRNMILMRMRKKNRIQFSNVLSQHLVTKIGGRVDNDPGSG